MSAAKQDIELVAGDASTIEITIVDGTSQPLDLSTAAELRWVLRRVVDGADLVAKTLGSGVTGDVNGLMTVQLETNDTLRILGSYASRSPVDHLHEAVIDMGLGEVTVCYGAARIFPTIAKLGIKIIPVFTYYVDPVSGNDASDGLSPETAWLTTTAQADTIPLGPTDTVGYLFHNRWTLYRRIGMLSTEFVLPSPIYTASSDQY